MYTMYIVSRVGSIEQNGPIPKFPRAQKRTQSQGKVSIVLVTLNEHPSPRSPSRVPTARVSQSTHARMHIRTYVVIHYSTLLRIKSPDPDQGRETATGSIARGHACAVSQDPAPCSTQHVIVSFSRAILGLLSVVVLVTRGDNSPRYLYLCLSADMPDFKVRNRRGRGATVGRVGLVDAWMDSIDPLGK